MALKMLDDVIKKLDDPFQMIFESKSNSGKIDQLILKNENENKTIEKKLQCLLQTDEQDARIQNELAANDTDDVSTQEVAGILISMRKHHLQKNLTLPDINIQEQICPKCKKVNEKKRFRKLIEGEILFLKPPASKRQKCNHFMSS